MVLRIQKLRMQKDMNVLSFVGEMRRRDNTKFAF